MKRSSYGERDYAFGQMMLTLRTHIRLTQAGLADRLGVSRRAVAEWEAGSSYPKAERLKELIVLGVRASAFAAGREAEEIRVLWKAAHQKICLDELWLHGLLGAQRLRLAPVAPLSDEQTRATEQAVPRPAPGPRVDWGEALAVPSFYGREEELATLTQWVAQDRCRVVSVLGMGGIGKSALATRVMHRVAAHFEVVLWRSLRDAPGCSALLEDCLQVLSSQPLREVPASLERRLGLLLEYLRDQRALLVLDNLEVLLEEREGTGRMRPGYEDYGRLLRRVSETEHQSCLLLTSREKPRDLVALEGSRTPVHSLRLSGLNAVASAQLLAEREVVGLPHDRERLIKLYVGNPLALKIVAETIVELFGSEIAPFLEQGEVVFGGVRELLAEQFDRLSVDEQTVLLWLAILREPVSIEELLSVLATPLSRAQMLDAVEALRRRSLIERGQRQGHESLVMSISWSPDGQCLASGSWDQTVRVWNINGGSCRWIGHSGEPVRIVAWNPTSTLVASGDNGGTINVWQGENGTQQSSMPTQSRAIYGLAWHPVDALLASGGEDGVLRCWDTSRGTQSTIFADDRAPITTIVWNRQGDLLISGRQESVFSGRAGIRDRDKEKESLWS